MSIVSITLLLSLSLSLSLCLSLNLTSHKTVILVSNERNVCLPITSYLAALSSINQLPKLVLINPLDLLNLQLFSFILKILIPTSQTIIFFLLDRTANIF